MAVPAVAATEYVAEDIIIVLITGGVIVAIPELAVPEVLVAGDVLEALAVAALLGVAAAADVLDAPTILDALNALEAAVAAGVDVPFEPPSESPQADSAAISAHSAIRPTTNFSISMFPAFDEDGAHC